MKIVFLSSSSNETTKYAQGLGALGWGKLELMRYDTPGATDQSTYRQVKAAAPDVIIYVGSRWGPQVSTHILARMNNEIAPTVHFCSDAADPPWWDLLRQYHMAGAFRLQVAIDGNHNWPLAESQMTALTPVDPIYFRHVNRHAVRPIIGGYAGNPGAQGSPRRMFLEIVHSSGLVTMRLRDDEPESYHQYCDFLTATRISINIPYTGSGAAAHVKGRVVESGLAGCLLLELKDSPVSQWFEPGVDYLEFRNDVEALDIIRAYRNNPEGSQGYGDRLREKVLARHTPQAFWLEIMERVGVKV